MNDVLLFGWFVLCRFSFLWVGGWYGAASLFHPPPRYSLICLLLHVRVTNCYTLTSRFFIIKRNDDDDGFITTFLYIFGFS